MSMEWEISQNSVTLITDNVEMGTKGNWCLVTQITLEFPAPIKGIAQITVVLPDIIKSLGRRGCNQMFFPVAHRISQPRPVTSSSA